MFKFPSEFFWGAAASAYQVEGNNKNSDWWKWEKGAGLKELSGAACRHYELFREDFDLARQLNHNAHRFSIEWGRIELEEGKFLAEEISHYRQVVVSLRERGIEPIITLHHFTNPVWFANIGAWQNKNAHKYFLRFVEKVVSALCEKTRWWVTINEPVVYTYNSYLIGVWPPCKKSLLKAEAVINNLARAHTETYRLIHDIYKKKGLLSPFVSIAKHVRVFEPYDNSLKNRSAAYLRDKLFNFNFLDKLIRKRSLDYIGITYYTRDIVGTLPNNLDRRGFLTPPLRRDKNVPPIQLDNPSIVIASPEGVKPLAASEAKQEAIPKKNSLGWDIYPEGLSRLLLRLNKYRLPIFILENGICTLDDGQRWDFIRAHLQNVQIAIERGVKVLGYLYWSLFDNYEWDKGFGHRFGLIDIDYNTYRRTVRESAEKFASVCKTGILL